MSTIVVLEGAADIGTIRDAAPDATVIEVDDLSLSPAAAEASVLLLRSGVRLGQDELRALPRLRHVVRTGSGLDNIDLHALDSRGISLHRNPDASAPAVAEWVLAAALALTRRIPLGHQGLAAGRHDKARCMGRALSELSVGIWGAGPVGRAVERVLAPHAARVAFAEWPSNPPGIDESPPEALMQEAQVHVIALPLRPLTREIIGQTFLDRVAPRRPLLICAGRVGTINIDACLRGLERGLLSGIALDAVEEEHVPHVLSAATPLNLLVSPHIGAQRTDVRAELDRWASALVRDLVRGDAPHVIGGGA